MNASLLNDILRLKALAETGLVYSRNEYDTERYKELQEMSFRMLHTISGEAIETLKLSLPASADYPTAKVDIRCLVLSANKEVLLVKESVDGKWSLPGGWADIGYTPTETAMKECKEETGLNVEVKALLAVFDTKMHLHPPEPFYVYKMVFLCQHLSTEINKGWDVLDVQYFSIENLPELSENRILKSQIELVYNKALLQDSTPYFD